MSELNIHFLFMLLYELRRFTFCDSSSFCQLVTNYFSGFCFAVVLYANLPCYSISELHVFLFQRLDTEGNCASRKQTCIVNRKAQDEFILFHALGP